MGGACREPLITNIMWRNIIGQVDVRTRPLDPEWKLCLTSCCSQIGSYHANKLFRSFLPAVLLLLPDGHELVVRLIDETDSKWVEDLVDMMCSVHVCRG